MAVHQEDFDKFLDKVDQENIITKEEYFKVENMETDKKARTLVNLMLQKDELTCRAFLQCLRLNPEEENSPEQKVKESPTDESEKGTVVKEKCSRPADNVTRDGDVTTAQQEDTSMKFGRRYKLLADVSPDKIRTQEPSLQNNKQIQREMTSKENYKTERETKVLIPDTTEITASLEEAAPRPCRIPSRPPSTRLPPEYTSEIFPGFSPAHEERIMRRTTKLSLKKHFHVAICSRDNEANFQWLKELMGRDDKVSSVDPVTITNDSSRFYQEMSPFTFAVLYHTRKRGRINITDVTDSLYDEELKFLHDELGKDNVIVVIDDLENSSESEKKRIIGSQGSIGKYSSGLFLFSEDNKNDFRVHTKLLGKLEKAKYLKRKKDKSAKKSKSEKPEKRSDGRKRED